MQRLKQKAINIVEHAEPNLPIIGLFATVGYPLFYIVWKYLFPQHYENLTLRLIEAVISLPWLFYRYLPKKAKTIFPVYFFISVPVLLPFFFHFMMLKNEWSIAWAMSSMACLFMLILIVYDWIFICIITLSGFVLAYAAVYTLDGHVSYTEFHIEYIPTYLFALIGGIVANHRKQIAHQTKISLLQSLSGSIAHEMRNPLSSITNAMSSLQAILPNKPVGKETTGTVDISQSGLISIHDVIEESSATIKRGNKIIDSILASLQGGSVDINNFKRLSAKKIIHTAINSYGYNNLAERKLLIDKTAVTFDFLGDKDLFIYVLFNLIKNALHYKNRPDFKIELTAETGNGFNIITVKDYGPGVPASKRERIFDRFYTYGKSGGNGLGLSFCRRVIESFGGEITCNSEEDCWTEFLITFPAYDSKAVKDIKKEILKNKRILIVDDQFSNRVLLAKYISEWNCSSDQAENGEQALEMLSSNRYDLIFMDFEMPSLNGDCAVQQLRSTHTFDPSLALHYLQAPIIGITALPYHEALSRAGKCGMNDVLSKPVLRPDILQIFERYFFSEKSTITSDQEELLSGSRILLVDDNETSRNFMRLILEHYGCSVGQAENGQIAIEMLEHEDYDLVLMDMEMPVLNGIQAAEAIRNGKYFSRFRNGNRIPIIALTGNTDEKSILRVKDAGMNHHLGKPISRDDLIATIAVWLNNSLMAENGNKTSPIQDYAINKDRFWKSIDKEKILDRSIINSLKEVGGKEMIDNIFPVFISDTKKIVTALATAAEDGNLKRYDQLIHELKGSSGSCGANRLYVLSRYIHEFSSKGKWPDNESWIDILEKTFTETTTAINEMLCAEKP
ncbi:MAG: response regulator [Chlorobium limicola]|uniref:response regulator n=1 Tax=Chlorobium limicola TaxID=1092 RepID=UPI0023F19B45|nr:response regulator [Chlorobium limicola]NTV21339.1 response regulator [Chlorobium limicola]